MSCLGPTSQRPPLSQLTWFNYIKPHKFYTAGLVGAKKTVPGLWRLSSMCFLLFEVFVVLFLLCWLLRWTDLFAFFFFVRVASCWLRSALVSTLDSAKYVCCKGPAALSSPSSIAKKHCPPCFILHRRARIMYISVTFIPRPHPAFHRLQYEATFQ